MFEQVWLVRHGLTRDNRARTIQGQRDVPLAPEGEDEASRLGSYLRARGVAFARIVCSDLSRAQRTAELVGEALGCGVDPDPRLREASYGEWEGLGYDDYFELVGQRFEEDRYAVTAPGGESPHQMAERVWESFADAAWSEEGAGKRLMVVSHGGPIQAMVSRVMGIPFDSKVGGRWRRSNTGFTVLERRARKDDYACVTINATPHLDGVFDL